MAGLAATRRTTHVRTRAGADRYALDRRGCGLSDDPPPRGAGPARRPLIVIERAPEWSSPGALATLATAIAIVWLLLRASTGDRFVPIVDHANLVFHEAGHLLLGLLSTRLAVYGGTLGQLVFPVAAAWQFHRRRHTTGFAFAVAWGCESMLNVAVYLGDARALQLPLIGGLDPETHHDWREILSRWGLLSLDTTLASLLSASAWIGGVAVCFWLMRRWLAGREGEDGA